MGLAPLSVGPIFCACLQLSRELAKDAMLESGFKNTTAQLGFMVPFSSPFMLV